MDLGSRSPDRLGAGPRGLSLALTAGVLAVHGLTTLPAFGWLAAACLPALLRWRGRAWWSALMLGVLVSVLQAQGRLADRWPAERHGEEVEATGRIASLVERLAPRPGESGATVRFAFAPEGAGDLGLPQRLRTAWYRVADEPRGGECWRLHLKVRAPHGSLDPGASDYEGWLYRQGIGATATVRDGGRVPCASGAGVLGWRQAIVDRLRGWLPEQRAFAMAAALAVGDESAFTGDDWDTFRRTGTSHLVAISGFNIAIVAGVAFFLVRWLWPRVPRAALGWPAQKAAMAAAAITGVIDGLLAGWGSPAQRSALMLVALCLGAMVDRRGRPGHGLALVWTLLLLVDPSQVLSPGCWLSFGAVAAIACVAGGRLGREPAWRLAVRVQLALSLVMAPATLFFFQGASWPGPLVNLVAVPAMAVLTPALIGAMAAAWVVPGLGVPLVHGVGGALAGFQAALAWIAGAAPQAWWPANPPAATLALAMLGMLLLFAPRGWPLLPLGALCLLPLGSAPLVPVHGGLDVTVLDVGQGLSAVVRTAHHVLLYDAGPAYDEGFDAGASIVVPFLLRTSGPAVDRLLLSHGDVDHAGGVPAVRRALSIGDEIGTPGHPPCIDGQRWAWDGVAFAVLHPPPGDGSSSNDRSCVLQVTSASASVLLAGDIEAAAEERLLRDHPDALHAEVLVAPHHGSRTSSSPAFVAAVAPRLVVFSAGWRSRFGHPRPEVVVRYADAGARTLTTGVEGAVHVTWDGAAAPRAEGWRRQARHFWNAPPEP